jgi:hypothetical protein
MSLDIRTGHTFRHQPTSQPPPAWAMAIGLAAFTLVTIGFAAGGWCVVFARYVTAQVSPRHHETRDVVQ